MHFESDPAFSDPASAATSAGLRYVSDDEVAGITRRRSGKGFSYVMPDGSRVSERGTLARIRTLAIPPAWTDVWISPRPDSHILATGRDAKGRKQYRYNPDFVAIRDNAKYEHLILFAELLPAVRRAVARDIALPGMPREKVLATIVQLLETTMIRVGNEDYARDNGSFGLTTLRNRHVRVEGSELRFLFKGKSGKIWRLNHRNRRVAKVVRACQELPGQHLFQYEDGNGEIQKISSEDVNVYLRTLSKHDITAKDFRTWVGTVQAAIALHEMKPDGPVKKNIRTAMEHVASRLGNTIAVCRKCYVHPKIISAYEKGVLKMESVKETSDGDSKLSPAEAAVLKFLKSTDA